MNIIPPEILIQAYSTGIFPMAESADAESVDWYTARRRGIIPIDGFRLSRRDMRAVRSAGFEPGIDRDFRAVITGCADRPATWISDGLKETFIRMHQLGYAHSVEVYRGGRLAGGLYGISIGGAFFAESMFQYEKEAMKAALLFCHRHLAERGFVLWDVQFRTEHLARFGCIEIPAKEYEVRLKSALAVKANF
jgi:leucyl/phenylalanyl-tRNA---protein transferase